MKHTQNRYYSAPFQLKRILFSNPALQAVASFFLFIYLSVYLQLLDTLFRLCGDAADEIPAQGFHVGASGRIAEMRIYRDVKTGSRKKVIYIRADK